jgi:predicted methyltransferase
MRKTIVMTGFAVFAVLYGCEKKAERPSSPAAAKSDAVDEDRVASAGIVVDYRAVAETAVNDPARPAADREKDAARKPVDALTFMEIRPGAVIFEIEAGGGWYTELLSRATGAGGKVAMQNPQGFLEFVSKEIEERLKDGRLANVTQSISNFDELEAADASVDLVTWVQGPHELYFKPSDGVDLGDPGGAYAEIYRILKPGGAFVAIDHSAETGAPETTGDTLHRIDKVVVMQMADQAGLKLVDEANFLVNPADDRKKSVFDPSIRGRTDQFVLRFRKDE